MERGFYVAGRAIEALTRLSPGSHAARVHTSSSYGWDGGRFAGRHRGLVAAQGATGLASVSASGTDQLRGQMSACRG
jgi:hypothetical protein